MGYSSKQILQPIDEVRDQVVEEITTLLENQTRTNTFAATISALIQEKHQDIMSDMRRNLAHIPLPAIASALHETESQFGQLDHCLHVLFNERSRQWRKNSNFLYKLLVDFDRTAQSLATTLVNKELLERQSQVLEKIILSHERISKWQDFVQDILNDFHEIFPFHFFFIAFAEEAGVSLNLYHMGEYSDEIKSYARRHFSKTVLGQLNLPEDAEPDINEYQVLDIEKPCTVMDVQMIAVPVPEHAPKLAGLLGVAFASAAPLTAQETSIIRAILSVMVMVVGSSKVLSRTLMELEYYSVHDPLTGLYNRRHFNELVEYELARSERHQHEFSVLLLDLDNFKDINDSYGHPCGDAVLRKIGELLRGFVRKGDTPTRLGGDEFAVLLPETSSAGGQKVAETLREALVNTFFESPEGKPFRITTSIGVITSPTDANSFTDLMTGVDIALYSAKKHGKNSVRTLDAGEKRIQENRDTRAHAEKLRIALEESRIMPYFQPIVCCRNGEVSAYETLARLREPDGEIVSAGAFMDAVEKYGLALDLDRSIIFNALEAKKAQAKIPGKKSPLLFINLSAEEIQGRGMLGFAEEMCKQFDVAPSEIVFEITERDAISDMSGMRRFLSNLRQKGFAFALDDFGSGYNSFHYLRELRFEYVKVDGAFVRNILNSQVDYALVENLCRLCKDLGIKTVAEFVESEALWQAIRNMGIDYAQGFHVGLPLPQMPTEEIDNYGTH
ncbi:MAG TPA: EAL domain-containing protein [Methylococcaceae bacterium]|nr:EAL domain-containing protein [Methylococcaceae bacterium]